MIYPYFSRFSLFSGPFFFQFLFFFPISPNFHFYSPPLAIVFCKIYTPEWFFLNIVRKLLYKKSCSGFGRRLLGPLLSHRRPQWKDSGSGNKLKFLMLFLSRKRICSFVLKGFEVYFYCKKIETSLLFNVQKPSALFDKKYTYLKW